MYSEKKMHLIFLGCILFVSIASWVKAFTWSLCCGRREECISLHKLAIKLVLEERADVSVRTYVGFTVLEVACKTDALCDFRGSKCKFWNQDVISRHTPNNNVRNLKKLVSLVL